MQSFLNDINLKNKMLSALYKAHEQQNLVPKPLFVDGKKGSPVTCMVDSDANIVNWPSKTGLPAWFALFIDGMYAASDNFDNAVVEIANLFKAMPIGCDISSIASHYIHTSFTNSSYALLEMTNNAAIRGVIQEIASAHLSRLNDVILSNQQWRALRRKASNVTDSFAEGSFEEKLGQCVESAAWDPQHSATTLYDVIRTQSSVVVAFEQIRSGWTSSTDEFVSDTLSALHQQAQTKATDDSFIDVFQLLEQEKPDLALRLRNKYVLERQSRLQYWQHCWTLFVSLLPTRKHAGEKQH